MSRDGADTGDLRYFKAASHQLACPGYCSHTDTEIGSTSNARGGSYRADTEQSETDNSGARDRARREDDDALSELKVRFEELTPRERTILIQVVEGQLNKQIAGEMGITETTVKVHRSNMMRKIKAASVAVISL